MSWLPLVVLGGAVGALVGLVFFGGLWWTTRRLATATRPGALLAVSLLARFAVLAIALIVLARLDPALLVGALVGVVAARIALTRAAAGGRRREPAAAGGSSAERG